MLIWCMQELRKSQNKDMRTDLAWRNWQRLKTNEMATPIKLNTSVAHFAEICNCVNLSTNFIAVPPILLLSYEQQPSSESYKSVQPTNTLWAGGHQVVKGVRCPEGFAMINNVVWCLIFFPAYARGCLSQPPMTYVRAETSNSSSEPV